MVITRQSERAPSLLRAYIHTLEGKLEPREQAVLTTLEQERPAWSERFPQALNAARHGILERLVNAMLRENLFGMGERQIRIVGEKVRCEEGGRERSTEVVEASECQDQSQGQSQGQSQDPSCDTCDALISSDSELFHETLSTLAQQGWNAPEWCFLPLHGLHGDSSLLALPIIREYGYGRLELAARPLHLRRFGREPYTIRQLSHPVELLKLWRDEVIQSGDLPLDTLDAFAEEIADSTANLALALCGAQVRRKELQTEASAAGQTTLLDYLTARRRADDTFSPLVFLESWIIDGHPIHPGTKLKQGMATSDLLRFAPEFAATPDLEFVAVHHALLETQSIDELSMTERLYLEHPEVALAAETDLAKKGLSISDYHIVPVHPWQR
ncbi:MAG TPA: IucA/IucC family protein, partial [Bacilli bacterium]|nr:IucA/IucC family protein [Bacilli bacterium]